MINLVIPYSNILLVASNSQSWVGWKNISSADDVFNSSQILSGNVEIAFKYKSRSKTSILIETRLDSDDGLNINFIEEVQKLCKKSLKTFVIFCIENYYDWHYDGPSPHGDLSIQRSSSYCVTPGLTVARAADFSGQVRLVAHSFMANHFKPCKATPYSQCLHWVSNLIPVAVMSRTPTSNSMGRVGWNSSMSLSVSRTAWKKLTKETSISTSDARRSKDFIHEHISGISYENLVGACKEGFSCLKTKKDKLKAIIDLKKGTN